MDKMRRGSEHPPSEKIDPSKNELDGIDDLEPEEPEADGVKGGVTGGKFASVSLGMRKSGGGDTAGTSAPP
jgi:hypothetical protein